MTVSRDVDTFWQELNKKVMPSGSATSRCQKISSVVACSTLALPSVDQTDQRQQSLTAPVSGIGDPAKCFISDIGTAEKRLQKPLQTLKDPSNSAHLKALQSIQECSLHIGYSICWCSA